jgi:hypothetical protein
VVDSQGRTQSSSPARNSSSRPLRPVVRRRPGREHAATTGTSSPAEDTCRSAPPCPRRRPPIRSLLLPAARSGIRPTAGYHGEAPWRGRMKRPNRSDLAALPSPRRRSFILYAADQIRSVRPMAAASQGDRKIAPQTKYITEPVPWQVM